VKASFFVFSKLEPTWFYAKSLFLQPITKNNRLTMEEVSKKNPIFVASFSDD
jgi:hypothetical protein